MRKYTRLRRRIDEEEIHTIKLWSEVTRLSRLIQQLGSQLDTATDTMVTGDAFTELMNRMSELENDDVVRIWGEMTKLERRLEALETPLDWNTAEDLAINADVEEHKIEQAEATIERLKKKELLQFPSEVEELQDALETVAGKIRIVSMSSVVKDPASRNDSFKAKGRDDNPAPEEPDPDITPGLAEGLDGYIPPATRNRSGYCSDDEVYARLHSLEQNMGHLQMSCDHTASTQPVHPPNEDKNWPKGEPIPNTLDEWLALIKAHPDVTFTREFHVLAMIVNEARQGRGLNDWGAMDRLFCATKFEEHKA